MQPPRPYGSAVARDVIGGASVVNSPADKVRKRVEENPVMVIGRRGCCMCHVARRLLLGLGVNPAAYEVGEEEEEGDVADRLREMISKGEDDRGTIQFPVVFGGGRWFGGLERVMTCHISVELEPVLRDAGALGLLIPSSTIPCELQ